MVAERKRLTSDSLSDAGRRAHTKRRSKPKAIRRESLEVARKLARGSISGLWNPFGQPTETGGLGSMGRRRSPARATDFLGNTVAKQDAMAEGVLRRAFWKIAREGWLRPFEFRVLGNGEAADGFGLIEALQSSGAAEDPMLEIWYARRALTRVEPNPFRWEAHPARTQEDVLRLIALTIEICGGAPPSIPRERPARRRGGWRVSA